jgi:hypothetical protein
MLSLILACVLSGPCDGGQCGVAILPRLRTANSVVERHREVKVTREATVTKEVRAERRVVAAVKARPHRIARVARVVLPPPDDPIVAPTPPEPPIVDIGTPYMPPAEPGTHEIKDVPVPRSAGGNSCVDGNCPTQPQAGSFRRILGRRGR